MRGRIEEIRQAVERHLMSTFLSLYVYYTVRDTIKNTWCRRESFRFPFMKHLPPLTHYTEADIHINAINHQLLAHQQYQRHSPFKKKKKILTNHTFIHICNQND